MFVAERLSPTIGADIVGLDVRDLAPGDHAATNTLRRLIAEHAVLRLRGQRLTAEALLAFVALFGPPHARWNPYPHSSLRLEAFPQIKVLSNLDRDGELLAGIDTSELGWHNDTSYFDDPTSITMLYGRQAPDPAPKTWFMDLASVYESLPWLLREPIKSLVAVHYSASSYFPGFEDEIAQLGEGGDRRHIGPRHGLALRNPHTGRISLFPPRHAASLIEGLPIDEGEKLSTAIRAIIAQFDDTLGIAVQPDDLVIWDNRFTYHRREAFDPDQARLVWQVAVHGEWPR